ncbi:MAG: glycosyltransferase, partial [Dehalococcoidia bacterium]
MYTVAFLSYHTSPIAPLGGRETGGMNVYVRELALELAERGHQVDIFTRRTDPDSPQVVPLVAQLKSNGAVSARLIHIDAGPAAYQEKQALPAYLDDFEAGVV